MWRYNAEQAPQLCSEPEFSKPPELGVWGLLDSYIYSAKPENNSLSPC
jgi:hypothetical protein